MMAQCIKQESSQRYQNNMVACASSNNGWRELQKKGYKIKLVAAQLAKPYVESNKSDAVDAETTCEAMSRPNMRIFAIKGVQQQRCVVLPQNL